MTSDPDVSLRDFMELRFDGLDKTVGDVKEEMGKLEKRVKTMEDCISNDVKHAIRMWRYICGIVVAIVVALAIAWLQQHLGL